METLFNEIDRAVEAGLMPANHYRERGLCPAITPRKTMSVSTSTVPMSTTSYSSPLRHAMHRETDLIDVWFDSGSMPYAQIHYPLKTRRLRPWRPLPRRLHR